MEQENLNTAASLLLKHRFGPRWLFVQKTFCLDKITGGRTVEPPKKSHVHNTVCTKTDWPTQLVAQKYQRQDDLFPSSFVFCWLHLLCQLLGHQFFCADRRFFAELAAKAQTCILANSVENPLRIQSPTPPWSLGWVQIPTLTDNYSKLCFRSTKKKLCC